MKLFIKIISPVIIIAGLYLMFRTTEIVQPPGILAPHPPKQSKIDNAKNWELDNFIFHPVANFSAKVRVLSISTYGSDDMSDFSPLDIAIGWSKMSDQIIINEIDIKQQHRWYVWHTKNFPIPRKEIERSSSNVHIIPSNNSVEDKLDDVIRGNIIQLTGKLVNVNEIGEKFVYKSSTRRDDTGSGACEILWLEEISIIQ